jgi:hypothetical protein
MNPLEGIGELSQTDRREEIDVRFQKVYTCYASRWEEKIPPRALGFIRNLLRVDPVQRMTATEALNHCWYQQPATEAALLREGISKINRFWKKRSIFGDGILEALPGYMLPQTDAQRALKTPNLISKYPDGSLSPYFGLEKHLQERPSNSGRKRILEDLHELGSQFITLSPHQAKAIAIESDTQPISGVARAMSVDGRDIFAVSNTSSTEDPTDEIALVSTDPLHRSELQTGHRMVERIRKESSLQSGKLPGNCQVSGSKRPRKYKPLEDP